MKKILFFFLFLAIGVALFIGVGHIVGWKDIWLAFHIFTSWKGMVIVAISAVALFFGMWKWGIILRSLGCKVSNKDLILPYWAGFSLIYFFPMIFLGGEIFKGYILKDRMGIPWRKAIASVVIDKILEGTVFLLTIIVGTTYFVLNVAKFEGKLAVLIGSVIGVLSIATIFFYVQSFRKKSITKHFLGLINKANFFNGELRELEQEIFSFFHLKKKSFWQAVGMAFMRVVTGWLRVWVLILFLGKTIGVLPAFSVLGFWYIALFVPIPATLGTHELMQAFAFAALGLGAALAPVFTMIQRASEIVIGVIGMLIFFRLGLSLLKTILFKKIDNLIDN